MKSNNESLSTVCRLKFDKGPCTEKWGVYYWDTVRNMCRFNIYGGCKGNANRFATLAACKKTCSPSGNLADNAEE
jgi:hypothetical protein